MKVAVLFLGLLLFSCTGRDIKYGESGNDNSHLRNPQYPNVSVKIPIPDSILYNNRYSYRLDRDLMLNGMFVLDTFHLDRCFQSIGRPDSVHRGGPKIIEEFGVDDFDIYTGKSIIYAGHGQILSFKIRDEKLKLNTIGVGSTREYFEKIMKLNFPDKDTIKCIGVGDGFYSFRFKKNKIIEIDYYGSPL